MNALARLLGAAVGAGAMLAAHAENPVPAPAEVLITRAFIPSSNNIQGEVRLLRRSGEAVMQTLLYSKFLRRGIHAMEQQERRAWPEGHAGYADSTNYLCCLRLARDEVLRDFVDPPGEEAPADAPVPMRREDMAERVKMMIEFTLDEAGAGFALYDIELAGPADQLVVVEPRRVAASPAAASYVSRAMRLMGERGLGLAGDALDARLAQAGWREVRAK